MIDLQERHKRIIQELLLRDGWVKGSVLAESMGVTPRTIRSDIAVINHQISMAGCEIQSSRKEGYRIVADHTGKLSQMLAEEMDIPSTPRDRIKKLSIRLLMADRESAERMNDLEEEMYISRTTLESSIYKIKSAMENRMAPVFVQREKGKIWTSGEEETKRFLLKELVVDRTETNYFVIEKYDDYFGKEIPEKMMEVVLQALDANDLAMTMEDTLHLVIFLAIKITRIFQGKAYTGERMKIEQSQDRNVKFAASITALVEEKFMTKFNEAEQVDLMLQISLMRLISKRDTGHQEIRNDKNHYEYIVDELLGDIKENFFIDLTGDAELKQGLVEHIQYMVKKRAKHLSENEETNPVLTLFKTEYPFVFDMALFIYEKFYDIFGLKLSEDELGYVATYLGVAIVKMECNRNAGDIKMAVVTGLNYGASRLLATRLKSIYGNSCQIIGPFSPYNVKEIIKEEPDLIVSTEPKKIGKGHMMQIQISPLLGSDDQNKIQEAIQSVKKNTVYEKLPGDIRDYFRKELFFYGLQGEDYRDVITQMATSLAEQGFVEEEFLEKTLAREEISSTLFGRQIAMPHPIEPCAKSTVISVGIPKRPIRWGEGNVELVFMLAIRLDDMKYLNGFFELIIRLMDDVELVRKLLAQKNFEDFIAKLPL